MKFNKAWIEELVPTSLSAEELAAQITMAGLEVDGIDPVAGTFNGVVIGEVVECAQHPDADKLRVTKVNVGEAELLDIVCGAPNCRQGLRVAVATVGAVLPGDFVIKKRNCAAYHLTACCAHSLNWVSALITAGSLSCQLMRQSVPICVNTCH